MEQSLPKGLDDGAAFEEYERLRGEKRAPDFRETAPAGSLPPRTALSLQTLGDQLDAAFPGRSTVSDGTTGDDRHCKSNPRSSDHCPNIVDGAYGVVTAFDLTHDPSSGCDAGRIVEAIRESRDRRVKYLIFARRICASYAVGDEPAWAWRPYSGANPHELHAHVSVVGDKPAYDDRSAWRIASVPA